MIAYIVPMFTIFQDYYTLGGEERRRIEMRRMSRCFTWFPFGELVEPNIYHQSVCFTRNRDFTWRVSDCEELGGFLTVDDQLFLWDSFLYYSI